MHLGTLRLPSWDCSCVEAVAPSSYCSSNEELRPAEGTGLDDLPDRKECKSHQHGLFATDLVADQDGQYGGEETSQVPDADGETLEVCDMRRVRESDGIGLWELSAK